MSQLTILRQIGTDKKLQNRLTGLLDEPIICSNCSNNKSNLSFSTEQLCFSCFREKFGEIKLQADNGEYYGGHKLHLAGGKLGDFEYGKMYLTQDYFIFMTNNRYSHKTWETIIPINTIIMDQWHISEESRGRHFPWVVLKGKILLHW